MPKQKINPNMLICMLAIVVLLVILYNNCSAEGFATKCPSGMKMHDHLCVPIRPNATTKSTRKKGPHTRNN